MTQPELRSKSEIRKRHNRLKELDPVPTPHDDRGVYNLNKNGLKHQARLAALRWLLESRSTTDVFQELKETVNGAVTADENGEKAKIRNSAREKELLWALQVDSIDDLEHPQTIDEQLASAKSDLFNLKMRVENVGYPQGDTDLVKLDADPDVDVELLIEQINTSYKAIAEAHHHLLNGPEQHED